MGLALAKTQMDKTEILNILNEKIFTKISTLENLISEARESNNDTKSSMGDKYETGREMLQQEINNLQIQLHEAKKQEDFLSKILLKKSEIAEKGALIKTEKGYFFISISAGAIVFNNEKIFAISPESPLAQAMHGKREGESFTLNGISQRIEEIW